MPTDPIRLPVLAAKKEDENYQFRDFLKRHCDLDADELDQKVFELTRHVWAGIDCTTCANCCKQVHPTFSDEEVDRLARRLKIGRQDFIDLYLKRTEAGGEHPWTTRSLPCPFLQGDRCGVYEDRPADCSGYPYLYEPEFAFRLLAMIERTSTCPIVYDVLEELKGELDFQPRAGGRRRRH